jgi:hypothetical protein
MPRQGPCQNPDCPAPENSSGQWRYLPAAFATLNSLDPGNCVCKKPDCLRWAGVKPPKQQPGRKAPRRDADSPRGDADTEVPRPPILVSLDEIWGSRYSPLPPRLLAIFLTSPSLPPPPLPACRYVNLAELGQVERSNPLSAHDRSGGLEYAVFGKWKRAEHDTNGIFGCWWVSVQELLDELDVAEEKLVAALETHEAELKAARSEAVEAARAPAPVQEGEGGEAD